MLPLLAIGAFANHSRSSSQNHFYTWFLVSAGLCFSIITAGHLYMLIFLWGLSGIPLYLLASGFDDSRASMGKKTLVLFGAAHGLMTIGAVMLVALSGTAYLGEIELSTINAPNTIAFLTLLSGGLMATGIFPFHSWVIAFGEFAPGRTSALLPVIIQRFAGIYLLIRLISDLFILSESMRIGLFSLASITVVLATIMSLIEHHAGKRLAFIQVVVGGLALMAISTGTPAGLKASIIYALAAGAAITAMFLIFERNLLHDNSLSKKLPALVNTAGKNILSSQGFLLMSLGGLPPFGIFAAHILLFKGLWEFFDGVSSVKYLSLLWVLVAVGAAGGLLATALLIKAGQQAAEPETKIEKPLRSLLFEMSILSFTLVAVSAAFLLFLTPFERIAQIFYAESQWAWGSRHLLLVAGCILLSMVAGIWAFRSLLGKSGGLLRVPKWIEASNHADIYYVVSRLVFSIHRPLSRMHDGVLQTYLLWVVALLVILFFLI